MLSPVTKLQNKMELGFLELVFSSSRIKLIKTINIGIQKLNKI